MTTPLLRWLCALAIPLASAGCLADIGTACDRSATHNPAVRYTEGTVSDGIYMSSEWGGELLYFPGGMRYSIEHKLGAVPMWWQAYLSFDRHGTDGGTVALAAGNQAEVPDINETALTIFNASCSEYWLLVVAGTSGSPKP
jgi:hypothetical protein